ncbi:MAG: chitobiase/beta-hexosaminidase C-terminal domain-containing protein [Lachnospiraceae bacterium]|nr:chitobiase/beta-hexosaminidase C-terminal domain-containing protein [Lachnospiraceae bacterium]
MRCPHCGKEVKEGMLLCPRCGHEFRFIPDFDPEIEEQISDTLNGLTLDEDDTLSEEEIEAGYYFDENGELLYDGLIFDIDGNEVPDDYPGQIYDSLGYLLSGGNTDPVKEEEYEEYEDDLTEEDYSEFDEEYEGEYVDELTDEDFDSDDLIHQLFLAAKKSPKRKIYLALAAAVIGLIIFIIAAAGLSVYRNGSDEYQASLARKEYDDGDIVSAISHMERALSLNPDDDGLKFELADYYLAASEDDKAILIYWEIIYGKGPGLSEAYEKLIGYYRNENDYKMLNEILLACGDNSVRERYKEYIAQAPDFSVPAGEYDDVQTLVLTGSGSGRIFYTLDGTEPTESSTLYEEPIELGLGNYDISAVYINSYGVISDTANATYRIYVRMPDPPVIYLEDGDYTEPQLIEVKVQNFCTVYYTTDGTPPTMEDGIQYTDPIPLPLGHSHFIFAAFSEEGVSSDIKECDYNLNIEAVVDIQAILQQIRQYNLNQGKTVDLEGHLPGNLSKYSYVVDSALSLDPDPDNSNKDERKIYFLVTENTVDTTSNSMRTGTYYLIDSEDSSLYKAAKVNSISMDNSAEGRESGNDGRNVQVFKLSEKINPEDYAAPPSLDVMGAGQ